MPNKKKQRNSFFFFMQDVLADLQKEGKILPNGIKDVAPIANPKWLKLSAEDKEYYEQKAKNYKAESRETMEGKLDCTGAPITKVSQERRETEEKYQTMVRVIKRTLKQLGNMEAVAKQKFYIGCFNIFCMTEEGVCVPAEFGVVEYSIEEGIIRTTHHFVDPGIPPIGYTYQCIQHSEDTHKIPISNFPLANKNYMYMFNQLKRFVNPNKEEKSPPIYCFPDEIEQAESVLLWLQEKSLDCSPHPFNVFDLAHLLNELLRLAMDTRCENFVDDQGLAKDILNKNVFDYVPKICCEWHEEQDVSNYCALGIAKRYSFLMSDHLCDAYDVEMIPEKHVPVREPADNISVVDPGYMPIIPKPIVNKIDAPWKPVTKHVQSGTIVTNRKSVYDTSDDKVVIPGAAPGIRTEIPVCSGRQDRTPPEGFNTSAAKVVRGPNSDFQFVNDEFPSLSIGRPSGPNPDMTYADIAVSIGRGRGAPGRQSTLPLRPQYAGIGRALNLNQPPTWSSVTKPH